MSKFLQSLCWVHFCWMLPLGTEILEILLEILSDVPSPNQNPGYARAMHYSTSTDFSITLFVFSSLAFNNRIENLTLITKFRGSLFSGALRQCLFCLQVAPALNIVLLIFSTYVQQYNYGLYNELVVYP